MLVQAHCHTYTIRTTLLLAHRVRIGYLQHTVQEVQFQVGLWCEGNVSGIVDADVSQWCRHLFLKGTREVTCYYLRNVLVVRHLMLSGGWQRSQILAHQVAQLLLVVVADDHRLEVRGVAEPLFVDVHDAVVAHLLQGLLQQGFRTWVVSIENGVDRVAIVHLGRCVTVGQEGMCAVHQALEGHIVASWLCEVEISQFKQRLHVLE